MKYELAKAIVTDGLTVLDALTESKVKALTEEELSKKVVAVHQAVTGIENFYFKGRQDVGLKLVFLTKAKAFLWDAYQKLGNVEIISETEEIVVEE